jgi:negative regulator of sigma E activity
MSDPFKEQVSEFIDDEMSVEQSEFFVRRMQGDASARQLYLRYQLIGAAVRGEYRYPAGKELGHRLGRVLDADESKTRPSRFGWLQIAGGAAVAASVALVAVLGLNVLGNDADDVSPAADAFSAELVTPAASADVSPLAGEPAQSTAIQYLMHHARYSSGVNRTFMRSSVIAGLDVASLPVVEAAVVE